MVLDDYQIETVASVLKKYLRELPFGVLSNRGDEDIQLRFQETIECLVVDSIR